MTNIIEQLKEQIATTPVILYMKGDKSMPRCGFSAKAVQILKACEVPFTSVDVLENPEIRQHLPEVSDWPTFPQLFVNGELIGGCDIMTELYENGELEKILSEIQESE